MLSRTLAALAVVTLVGTGSLRAAEPKPNAETKAKVDELVSQADAQIKARKFAAAHKTLNAALELQPRNTTVLTRKAKVFNEQGNYEGAVVAGYLAVKADDKCSGAWYQIGYALRKEGDYKLAGAALVK